MDRGDGVCRYFESSTKLCRIYYKRPVLCDVDKTYELYFKDKMTKEEYYNENYKSCEKIKNGKRGDI
jgi:hypothetical protein